MNSQVPRTNSTPEWIELTGWTWLINPDKVYVGYADIKARHVCGYETSVAHTLMDHEGDVLLDNLIQHVC